MKIHPAAIVSTAAQIAADVEIGPYTIIEPGVVIEPGCRIASHVVIKEGTTLGHETVVSEGAVLGGTPQHLAQTQSVGKLVIGHHGIIREQVTVHRALQEGNTTQIGNHCMFMIGAHVAHDCQVGNRVILTNNVLLAGHVEIHDQVCLGGASAVHQFCRVGRLAMIGAQARIVQDVPPFVLTDGDSGLLVGLNRVGLQRADFSRADMLQLKDAYRLIYRRGFSFEEMVTALEAEFPEGPAADFATFFHGVQHRGFVRERRRPPQAAIRLHQDRKTSEPVERKRKAS